MNKTVNLNKLKKKVEKYEYVSFDIFDTLIKRNIYSPTQVPILLEKKNNILQFAKNRINSEQYWWNYENQKHFNFNSIYKSIENISDNDKNNLMKEEIELEKKICLVNYNMIDIYNYCKKIGKKIILISDMYMNRNIIEDILKQNGIDGYDKIYISSDYGVTKSNSKLFKTVINNLNINSKDIIHIGDSLRSDYLIPKIQKIASVKIPNKVNNLFYQNYGKGTYSLDDNILQSYINNTILDIKDPYEKIGYETLGALLIGFSQWIKNECDLKEIRDIYFLSRDGYIMQKAFNILFDNEKIDTHYFLASRRSLTVPLLKNITDFTQVLDIINFRKIETFENILKRTGIEKLLKEDEDIRNLKINRDKLKENKEIILKFNKYLEQIRNNAEMESNFFVEYFKDNVKSNNIAIVDIGWHGTMQKCLNKILKETNIDCNINGYYLGLTDKEEKNKESFIFNNNVNNFNSKLVSAFRGVIESFFSANHGSAKRYIANKSVELETFEQSSYNKEIIGKIQNGALKCVERYKKLELDIYEEVTSKYSFQPLYNLMTKPDLYTIKILKDIDFFDTENRKLIENRKATYLLNPKNFMNDFVNSDWRIGYLKNTFKIFNNYDKVVEFIYKIMKK